MTSWKKIIVLQKMAQVKIIEWHARKLGIREVPPLHIGSG